VNLLAAVGKHVYEFRSGRLIPGEFTTDGDFVPELGGSIRLRADERKAPELRSSAKSGRSFMLTAVRNYRASGTILI
jgi:hypothetical protein